AARRPLRRRPGIAQRDVRQSPQGRVAQAGGRGRAAGGQVQADLSRRMSMEIDMAERVEDASIEPPEPAAGSSTPASTPDVPAQSSLPGTEPDPAEAPPKPEPKSLTIGAVCKQLEREFPDISISKIRYLEDQKLLTPRRTRGGYRLYSPGDVD